jgi:N-acetyl-gamma-glutamyl-phosphate reductase
MKIAVVGAISYPGSELIRLLVGHPGGLHVEEVVSVSAPGTLISDSVPSLRGYCDLTLEPFDVDALAGRVDTVVLSVPHTVAQEYVPHLLEAGLRVVDFSADYRLHQADLYDEWYHESHKSPHLLERAVYGLPERYRNRIPDATLVANPGCYPTCAILGALPLIEHDMVEPNSLIVDAKSGISGASKKPSEKTHFVAREANVTAYNVGIHRHTPEIEQELSVVAASPVQVTFVPHLVPMSRGILSTIYASLRTRTTQQELIDVYQTRYKAETFVHVLGAEEFAETKAVLGSNNVHVSVHLDSRNDRVVVTCALDNLVKGAAGAAVQNLNLMAGLPEATGLRLPGLMV